MRILTFAACALFASHAIAADLFSDQQEAAPIVAYDLGGVYAGIQGGPMAGGYDLEIGPLGVDSFGEIGGFVGGHIGVQGVWNWLLLGVEGGLIVDNSDHKIDFGAASVETSEDYLYYFGFKAGVPIGEEQRVAPYLMAGYEAFDTKVSISGIGGGASFKEHYDCGFARAGVDLMLTERLMFGAFGQYTLCGDQGWNVGGLNVNKELIRAGAQLSYKLPVGALSSR